MIVKQKRSTCNHYTGKWIVDEAFHGASRLLIVIIGWSILLDDQDSWSWSLDDHDSWAWSLDDHDSWAWSLDDHDSWSWSLDDHDSWSWSSDDQDSWSWSKISILEWRPSKLEDFFFLNKNLYHDREAFTHKKKSKISISSSWPLASPSGDSRVTPSLLVTGMRQIELIWYRYISMVNNQIWSSISI